MKKKFSLWLNIVTICLCMCAIAIGVYAATNATLTINGQIGFQAHGCDIDASGYMYGYATTDGNNNEMPVAQPTTDAQKEQLALSTINEKNNTPKVAEVRGSTAEGLTLGNHNFTDMNSNANGKPTDIVIVLTLKNQSLFDIYGVVSATSDSPNIGIKKSVGLFNLGKKVVSGETETIKEIEVTITLSIFPDVNKNYNDVTVSTDNIHISIDFNKGKLEDNLLKKDTTNNYYYVEMGTHTYTDTTTNEEVTVPLKWYAFAYKGTEAADYGSATTTTVTNYSSGSYYFISEKVLLMNSLSEGVAFNSKTYANAECYKALDYAHESTIRPIVNGQAEGSVYDTYGIEGSPIYNAITNRDLDGDEYIYYDKTVSPSTETKYRTSKTYNQTLWLLNKDEANNHFAEGADRQANPVGVTTSDYAFWFLRSSNYADSGGFARAWYVGAGGNVYDTFVSSGRPGVRPGFQLDIDLTGGVTAA